VESLRDINDNGLVVGDSGNSDIGKIWNPKTGMIETLSFYPNFPLAINNNGVVIGILLGSDITAFEYDSVSGEFQQLFLDVIGQWRDDISYGLPRAINDDGVIVGNAYIRLGEPPLGSMSREVAVIWDRASGEISPRDLNQFNDDDLAFFSFARDINASGQILVDGEYDGMSATFLLTPVPIPAALPLLIGGLAGLGLFTRRRKTVSS
jgi:uncharacterized membrane protein